MFTDLNSLIVTRLICSIVLFLDNLASKYFEALSTWVTPITVSLSQCPISIFASAIAGRNSIPTRFGSGLWYCFKRCFTSSIVGVAHGGILMIVINIRIFLCQDI